MKLSPKSSSSVKIGKEFFPALLGKLAGFRGNAMLSILHYPCRALTEGFGPENSLKHEAMKRSGKFGQIFIERFFMTQALALTLENVESVLNELRPYLMADGGNVEVVELDGPIVKVRLQGACGSCPSSTMTLKMGIERKLRESIPEIAEVEQVL